MDGYLVKPIHTDTLFNEMSKFLKYEFREKGFSGFLNKPVSPNDISTVLQKWLNIE